MAIYSGVTMSPARRRSRTAAQRWAKLLGAQMRRQVRHGGWRDQMPAHSEFPLEPASVIEVLIAPRLHTALRGALFAKSDKPTVTLSNVPIVMQYQEPKDPTALARRAARARTYFTRKATAVLWDDDAMNLLVSLMKKGPANQEDFGISQQGLAFAKLAAAGFVDIGATVVHITHYGSQFLRALEEKWNNVQAKASIQT